MADKTDHSTRRDLLRKAGVGATAGLVSGIVDAGRVCATQVATAKTYVDSDGESDNLITRENSLPGATDWQLTRVRTEPADGVRCPAIEGFCTRQSVRAGETLGICVSTAEAKPFKLEIFRTGYYGGRGARLVKTIDAERLRNLIKHRACVCLHINLLSQSLSILSQSCRCAELNPNLIQSSRCAELNPVAS